MSFTSIKFNIVGIEMHNQEVAVLFSVSVYMQYINKIFTQILRERERDRETERERETDRQTETETEGERGGGRRRERGVGREGGENKVLNTKQKVWQIFFNIFVYIGDEYTELAVRYWKHIHSLILSLW